jgi:hypothetical protein
LPKVVGGSALPRHAGRSFQHLLANPLVELLERLELHGWQREWVRQRFDRKFFCANFARRLGTRRRRKGLIRLFTSRLKRRQRRRHR